MAVYVDDVRHQFGRMIMCHMWADDLDELHAMADAIGIARKWFQQPPKASWKHYDISISKKSEAIARGAVLTDKYGPVLHTVFDRYIRAVENGDVEARDNAVKMTNSVLNLRGEDAIDQMEREACVWLDSPHEGWRQFGEYKLRLAAECRARRLDDWMAEQ